MKTRTALVLFLGALNSGFLCWYFVMLLVHGQVVVAEPVRLIAGIEVALTAIVAGASLERLLRLKERT